MGASQQSFLSPNSVKRSGFILQSAPARVDSTQPENGFRFRVSRHNGGNLIKEKLQIVKRKSAKCTQQKGK